MLGKAKRIIDDFYHTYPHGVVVIWGATATGKSGLSLELSQFYDMEVISSDSRQLYKHMTIGTDKVAGKRIHPDGPYISTVGNVPHYLVDMIEPDESYSAGKWKTDATVCINNTIDRGKRPFVVGGTGLYIDMIYKNFRIPHSQRDEAFREQMERLESATPGILHQKLQAIDPVEAERLHPHSVRYIVRALEIYEHTGQTKSSFMERRKPNRPLLMLGLWREKESTNRRINRRIKEMLTGGLIQEVQGLLNKGFGSDLQSMQGIGYKQVIGYLTKHHDIVKLEEELKRDTHYLAKKQRSWFRRYITDGVNNNFDTVVYHVINLEDENM